MVLNYDKPKKIFICFVEKIRLPRDSNHSPSKPDGFDAMRIRPLGHPITDGIKAVTSCSTHKIDQQETDG